MHLKSKLGGAAAAAVLAFGLSTAAQAQMKVGFVYVGPIGDHGWNYQHHQGLLALKKALGSKVTTTHVEKVAENADATRVITKMASTDTTSFSRPLLAI